MHDNTDIRDEEILLLGLCRLYFTEELSDRLIALARKIKNWEYFTRLASLHGVSALVSHNLEAAYVAGEVPEKVLSELRSARMMSLSRNAFLLSAAENILRTLNEKSIKCILLKGVALENTVYGNSGLRQMTDIDLLMESSDCLLAAELLAGKGFTRDPLKSWFHKPIILYAGKHMPGLKKDGISVDIHHDLFGGRRKVLTKLLYDNSTQVKLGEQRVFIPDPQLFFLYLVKHLWLHEMNNESQLRLYTDLVALLETKYGEIINYDLIDYASKTGMTRILAWKLEVIRDLWGIGFPDWIDDFIDKWYSPGSINSFAFFLRSPKNNPQTGQAKLYRKILSDIPGVHRKLLFLAGDLIPTITFMKKRYNCSSTFSALLRYPLRLGKLLLLIKR